MKSHSSQESINLGSNHVYAINLTANNASQTKSNNYLNEQPLYQIAPSESVLLGDSILIDEQYAEVSVRMQESKRWLLWKSKPSSNGKVGKVPFYTNGNTRSATDTPLDTAHLATFEDAKKILVNNLGLYAGLGFALGADGTGNYWQGIDLDDIPNRGWLEPIESDVPGYVERSPSGKGSHAIGYGKFIPTLAKNESGIEVYASGRFFTVTGQAMGIGEPVDLSSYVDHGVKPLHDKYSGKNRSINTNEIIHNQEIIDPINDIQFRHLRSALTSIRSDDRGMWIDIGHALKTAGERGRALWIEWSKESSQWMPEDARQWDTFHPTQTHWKRVFILAKEYGWVNGDIDIDLSPTSKGSIDIRIKEFIYRSDIPPRKLITLGGMKFYAKGFLSVSGAAGGVGKSSLSIVEELSLVYGLDLLDSDPTNELNKPKDLKCGRQRVWSMSLEDDEEEHQRRVFAAIELYKLDPTLLSGYYFVTYKNDSPINIATVEKNGFVVSPQIREIERNALENKIDVLVVDPFVNCHAVPENDNGAMNKVADLWRGIAQRNLISISLTHHTRKANGISDVSADDLRGAVSLVGAARVVRVTQPMSIKEANHYGVLEEHRRYYFWVNSAAKANIVPPSSNRFWFHMQSVNLQNEDGLWESDSLGVVHSWHPSISLEKNDDEIVKVWALMGGQNDDYLCNFCRESNQAHGWIGLLICKALDLNPDNSPDKYKVNSIIRNWLRLGILRKRIIVDPKGKQRPCLEMINQADELGLNG